MDSTPPAACLCFSKDRPLQLDGYLKSLRQAFGMDIPVAVLFAGSTPRFLDGYEAVSSSHPAVRFMPERDFGTDVLGWLHSASADHILFGCDDVVYYRDADLPGAVNLLAATPDILGFSFRLGKNIRYTHAMRGEVVPPRFDEKGDWLAWAWGGAMADWGWAFEVNGTLYRKSTLLALFGIMDDLRRKQPDADWRHPNKLEMTANRVLRILPGVPPKMACARVSSLVVPTVNQVQTLSANPLMGESKSPEQIEEMRRKGVKMDIRKYRETRFSRIHIGEFFLEGASPPS